MQIIALIMLMSIGIDIILASLIDSSNIDNRHRHKYSSRICSCDQTQGDSSFTDYCCN